MSLFGKEWDYEFMDRVKWFEFEIPSEQNAGVEGEICGWWSYEREHNYPKAANA